MSMQCGGQLACCELALRAKMAIIGSCLFSFWLNGDGGEIVEIDNHNSDAEGAN